MEIYQLILHLSFDHFKCGFFCLTCRCFNRSPHKHVECPECGQFMRSDTMGDHRLLYCMQQNEMVMIDRKTRKDTVIVCSPPPLVDVRTVNDCKICDEPFDSQILLYAHVRMEHKMRWKKYYDIYISI